MTESSSSYATSTREIVFEHLGAKSPTSEQALAPAGIPNERVEPTSFQDIYSGSQVTSRAFLTTVVNPSGKLEAATIAVKKYQYPIQLFGEQFVLDQCEEGCFIYHPNWSLMGTGPSLAEAQADLIETIREVRNQLVHTAVTELDAGAFQFRDFLIRLNV